MKKLLLQVTLLFSMTMGAFAQNLVISEIYYNSPNSGVDSLEYVEIYNKGTATQNLKNFTFRSAFNDTLPDFNLAAGEYYVLTLDSTFFKKATKTSARQWRNGNLSNTGETIQLWSNSGMFVDSVRYRTVAPWPLTSNGNGPSMELCDVVNGNNDQATSWGAATIAIGYSLNNQNGQAVAMLGSPGKANKCATGGGGTGGTLVAKDINARTPKNTNANINIAQGNMIQGNTITSSLVVTQPTNGTATKATGGGGGVNNTTFTYMPKAGFIGTDKFNYAMCTANGCDTATINIVVYEATYYGSTIGKITAQTAVIGTTPDSLNRYVEVTGVVHSPSYAPQTGMQFTLIDQKYKTDGIEVARATTVGGYVVKEGDLLKVKGRVGQNAGVNRLIADTLWVTKSGVTLHEPTLISILDESTENMLVSLEAVSIVDSTKWTNTGAGNNFVVEVTPDGGATKYQVRIDKDFVELSNWTAPKGKFDLSGIGYQAIAGGGGGGGGQISAYQIMPRYKADFKFSTAANDVQLGRFVNIYPNPFNEQIMIQLATPMDVLLVQDIFGKTITKLTQPSGNQMISSSDWVAGVYFVTLQKEGKQFVTKLVKQ